eukprot:3547876-Lingulodinium_polyedra.AAC.1
MEASSWASRGQPQRRGRKGRRGSARRAARRRHTRRKDGWLPCPAGPLLPNTDRALERTESVQ